MPDDLDSEFAAAVRRAGVTIPAERWDVMRDAYASLKELLKVLDEPLTYADEPAVLPRYDRSAGR